MLHLITCHGRIMPPLPELLLHVTVAVTFAIFQSSGNLPSSIDFLEDYC